MLMSRIVSVNILSFSFQKYACYFWYLAMSATAISTLVIFKALGLVLNRQTHNGATGAPPGPKIPLTNHH